MPSSRAKYRQKEMFSKIVANTEKYKQQAMANMMKAQNVAGNGAANGNGVANGNGAGNGANGAAPVTTMPDQRASALHDSKVYQQAMAGQEMRQRGSSILV